MWISAPVKSNDSFSNIFALHFGITDWMWWLFSELLDIFYSWMRFWIVRNGNVRCTKQFQCESRSSNHHITKEKEIFLKKSFKIRFKLILHAENSIFSIAKINSDFQSNFRILSRMEIFFVLHVHQSFQFQRNRNGFMKMKN